MCHIISCFENWIYESLHNQTKVTQTKTKEDKNGIPVYLIPKTDLMSTIFYFPFMNIYLFIYA